MNHKRMNYRTSFLSLTVITFFALSVASCKSGTKKNDPNHLIVGVESGPEYKIAQVAQKVAKSRFNLDVELVQFNDYVMPNEALLQKDIDVNAFQSRPYLDVQAKARGYKFIVQGNTFVYPIAGYSRHIKTLSQLQDESTIIIPNDPTNSGRSLLLMEKSGLITLRKGVGLLPTVNDISSNPKKLKIIEMEAPQLTRALDDKNVSIAIINNTFSPAAGLIPSRDGLFVEDARSPYVNIVVSREDNKNDLKIKNFVKAYQSVEVENAALSEFKGGAIKGW